MEKVVKHSVRNSQRSAFSHYCESRQPLWAGFNAAPRRMLGICGKMNDARMCERMCVCERGWEMVRWAMQMVHGRGDH